MKIFYRNDRIYKNGGVCIRQIKLYSTVLPIAFLAFLISVFPFLSGRIPVYSGNTEPDTICSEKELDSCGGIFQNGNACLLETGDSLISLDVSENRLFVTYFANKTNGINKVTRASEFNLPVSKAGWIFEKCSTAVNDNSVSATYTFCSSEDDVLLNITCSAHHDTDGPFEFSTEIINSKPEAIRIAPRSFASFDFVHSSGETLTSIKKESGMAEGYRHYDGQLHKGTGIYSDKINIFTNKSVWLNTYQNWNDNGYLPMTYIGDDSSGVYTALEWSSGRINVNGGINGTSVTIDMDKVSESKGNFSTVINSESSFIFPTVYLGVFDGSIDDGSNIFKQWFFKYKVPDILRDNPDEPLTQMDMQSGLNTYGVEAIKWDYGWWSDEVSGDWKSLEGSWRLRNRDYISVLNGYGCSTIKEFTDLAKESNISVTTYGLLHDTITPDGTPTVEFGEFNSLTHPEWFSDRCVANGMGNSADLGNAECVEFLKTYLKDYFISNGVTTWRSDFEPICYSSDKKNRHDANGTDVQYWCTTGFGELVDYLYENVAGFRYESCSSGASMKDLFTATKAVIINCDDAANYSGMRATFYDSSYVIHPAQLQMPCNQDFANPDAEIFYPKVKQGSMTDSDFKKAMLDIQFRTQCLGVPMFSSWTGNLQTEYYEKYAEIYKAKLRPIIRNGNLYHILPRPDGINWDGIMYADIDSDNEIKGVIFLFKPSAEAGNAIHINLQGLDESRQYQLVFEDHPEQNINKSGASLMADGLDVTIPQDVGSDIIWIY